MLRLQQWKQLNLSSIIIEKKLIYTVHSKWM